jgi:hypothetical protein
MNLLHHHLLLLSHDRDNVRALIICLILEVRPEGLQVLNVIETVLPLRQQQLIQHMSWKD